MQTKKRGLARDAEAREVLASAQHKQQYLQGWTDGCAFRESMAKAEVRELESRLHKRSEWLFAAFAIGFWAGALYVTRRMLAE